MIRHRPPAPNLSTNNGGTAMQLRFDRRLMGLGLALALTLGSACGTRLDKAAIVSAHDGTGSQSLAAGPAAGGSFGATVPGAASTAGSGAAADTGSASPAAAGSTAGGTTGVTGNGTAAGGAAGSGSSGACGSVTLWHPTLRLMRQSLCPMSHSADPTRSRIPCSASCLTSSLPEGSVEPT